MRNSLVKLVLLLLWLTLASSLLWANDAQPGLAVQSLLNPEAMTRLLGILRSPEQFTQVSDLHLVGLVHDPRVTDALIALLKDKTARIEAIPLLGTSGDPRAVAPLLTMLPELPVQTAYALGALGDIRAVSPLLALLPHVQGVDRGAVAAALGMLADPRAVLPLLPYLDDTSTNVRVATAAALGGIRDERAVPALRAAFTVADQPNEVRRAIVSALGEIRDTQAVPVLATALRECGTDNKMRLAVVQALGEIPGDESAALLVNPATAESSGSTTDEERWIRLQAIAGLGRHESTLAITTLSALAQNDEVKISSEALIALATIPDRRSILAVQRALLSKQQIATHSGLGGRDLYLAWLANPALTSEDLLPLLAQPDDSTRMIGALGLAARKDARAVPVLVYLLATTDYDEGDSLLYALGSFGPTAEEALLAALTKLPTMPPPAQGTNNKPLAPEMMPQQSTDESPGAQRGRVAMALGRLHVQRAIPAILPLLQQQNTRAAALEALGELQARQIFPELLKLAEKEPDITLRCGAIRALGGMRDASAVPLLLHALATPDVEVHWKGMTPVDIRVAAAEALGRIGTKTATAGLAAALQDKYPAVRKAAAMALGLLPHAPQALHALLTVLLTDKMAAMGSGEMPVIQAVASYRDDIVVPALLFATMEPFGLYNMRAVLQALALRRDPRTRAFLQYCLRSDDRELEDREIRRSAISGLAALDDARVVPTLIRAANDSDPAIRASAAAELQRLNHVDSKPHAWWVSWWLMKEEKLTAAP